MNFRNVFIMNNVKIHRNDELRTMCVEINVQLEYLFSYFFDYNFIEIFFVILKIWIKKNIYLTKTYTIKFENFDQFLNDAMQKMQRVQTINKNDKKNFDNLFRFANIVYS